MSQSLATAAELVRVQKLYLRLLYCEQTARVFAADSTTLLAQWGLPLRWREVLPDTTSRGHRNEMHGRRVLAADDLKMVFEATLRRLGAGETTRDSILQARWFSDFLSSEAFFDPSWSLPHPMGIGRGYEGHSRFFFWARDAFHLRSPQADLMLRDDLYLDFAACMDQRMVDAVDPDWDRFKSGFFWSQVPNAQTPCRGLDRERRVLSVDRANAREELVSLGLMDMDRLEP